MIPPKRFDISPPDWGMLRRSRCLQISLTFPPLPVPPFFVRVPNEPSFSTLRVNFNPLVARLLREVKYFLLLGLRVPASALEVYGRAEVGEANSHTLAYQKATSARFLFFFREGGGEGIHECEV